MMGDLYIANYIYQLENSDAVAWTQIYVMEPRKWKTGKT